MAKPFYKTLWGLAGAGMLGLAADAVAASKKRATAPSPASPAAAQSKDAPAGNNPPGDALGLHARGAIVIDAHSGQTLYEKNADTPQFPASTTKVMTALLVIESGNLDQEVEITLEDSKVSESSLEIKPGGRFSRQQMLYGLMLKSANDVAHALGRDNAGSVKAFAEKMTIRARELGATSTRFVNPHGLHHIEHYTTPGTSPSLRAAPCSSLFSGGSPPHANTPGSPPHRSANSATTTGSWLGFQDAPASKQATPIPPNRCSSAPRSETHAR